MVSEFVLCDSSLAIDGAPFPDDTLVVAKAPGTVTLYPRQRPRLFTWKRWVITASQHKTASVYQSAGALVLRKVLTNDKETLILRGLAPGVYLLSVGDGADRRTYASSGSDHHFLVRNLIFLWTGNAIRNQSILPSDDFGDRRPCPVNTASASILTAAVQV